MIHLAKQIQKFYKQREAFVVVTLFQIKGSAPQIVGAKMLVTDQGLQWGTVGGGKIEAHCIRYSQSLLEKKATSESQFWNLQKDIGMSCGGEVGVFFDVVHANPWHITIFGAGHISQELCRVLQTWSCQVSVFDNREEWVNKLTESENINKKVSQQLADEVSSLPKNSYLLCMTMGHTSDLPILHQAFKNFDSFSLIGVIGSDVKAMKIKKELNELGIPQEKLNHLISPLGLPIGDNTPSEIAISICSLLLAKRDNKSFTVENGLSR